MNKNLLVQSPSQPLAPALFKRKMQQLGFITALLTVCALLRPQISKLNLN